MGITRTLLRLGHLVAGESEKRDAEEAPVCCCDGNGSAPCWQCGGAGGFHDCGEDCCACLDQGGLTERCDECDGRGYFSCSVCSITEQ